MLLRVICQVCGRTTTINTKHTIGPEPRWDCYKLEAFGINPVTSPFYNYSIWVCNECHDATVIWEGDFLGSETGIEYDWELLTEMVLKSLGMEV